MHPALACELVYILGSSLLCILSLLPNTSLPASPPAPFPGLGHEGGRIHKTWAAAALTGTFPPGLRGWREPCHLGRLGKEGEGGEKCPSLQRESKGAG